MAFQKVEHLYHYSPLLDRTPLHHFTSVGLVYTSNGGNYKDHGHSLNLGMLSQTMANTFVS